MREGGRRERLTAHQCAAVEKQIEFADRQRDRRVAVLAPQTRESPAFEALRVHAQPGAIPVQDLRAHPITTQKEEHIAAQDIALQTVSDERGQSIETLAPIDG